MDSTSAPEAKKHKRKKKSTMTSTSATALLRTSRFAVMGAALGFDPAPLLIGVNPFRPRPSIVESLMLASGLI